MGSIPPITPLGGFSTAHPSQWEAAPGLSPDSVPTSGRPAPHTISYLPQTVSRGCISDLSRFLLGDLSPHLLSCQTYRETLFPRLRQSFSESLGERLWLFKKKQYFLFTRLTTLMDVTRQIHPSQIPSPEQPGGPPPIPVCLGLPQLYSQKPLNPGQTRMLGSPQLLPSRGSQFGCRLRDSVKSLGDKMPQLSSLMLGTAASF